MAPFVVRPTRDRDREWVRRFTAERWGAEVVAVHGVVYRPDDLAGFIAEDEGGRPLGLATYVASEGACELVTLDSVEEGRGVGTALVEAVAAAGRDSGCARLWLVTTNDNLHALGFYQRRGFHLAAVHRGAVAKARELKPSIPEVAPNGIPLRDELELEMALGPPGERGTAAGAGPLGHLLANNTAWAEAQARRDPGFFGRLAAGQNPRCLWIGCSDSRVPPEALMRLPPGELFVHRNIANLVSPGDASALSAVQFAVEHLGVDHVVVCGHYRCGGVGAALGPAASGPLESWIGPVRRLAEAHGKELSAQEGHEARWRRLCELNVVAQVDVLRGLDPVRRAWDEGRSLLIHGWMFDLETGRLRDLEITAGGPPAGFRGTEGRP